MHLPVLIITYKRFDFVLAILKHLKNIGLTKVYLSVDHYPRDPQSFSAVETYLATESFDYKLLKWDTNVGCDHNVMEGIRWFFNHEPSGIILEDDCLPTNGFASVKDLLQLQSFRQQNISFFSTSTLSNTTLNWTPVYLPFFWGWYTTASFFDAYYSFYLTPQSFLSLFKKLSKAGLSLKLQLITLLNFYAHRSKVKGVAWDSELFLFSILKQQPFLMPDTSLINNLGFGELSNAFTHTQQIPDWYKAIKFQETAFNAASTAIHPFHQMECNLFLETFYSSYPNNHLKLTITLFRHYLRYLLRK